MTQIKIFFSTLDGIRKTRSFKTLDGARKFANDRVGSQDVDGGHYAVSCDGVAKIEWSGCTRADLFGEIETPPRDAQNRPGHLAVKITDEHYELYCGKQCPMNLYGHAILALDQVTGDNVVGWALRHFAWPKHNDSSYGPPLFSGEERFAQLADALTYAKEQFIAFQKYLDDEARHERAAGC